MKKEGKYIDRLTMNYERETDKARAAYWDRVREELEDWNAKGRTDLVYARLARLT